MNTIEEAKADKEKLQEAIADLIRQFEKKYGQDTVSGLRIERWNGSNNAYGVVSRVQLSVELC